MFVNFMSEKKKAHISGGEKEDMTKAAINSEKIRKCWELHIKATV